ncbi:MAG: zinc ABC transporter substrate-binding protein, partial [Actinomycetota bacterium]
MSKGTPFASRRSVRLAAISAAFVLVAAACGDDDNESSDTSAAPDDTTTATTDEGAGQASGDVPTIAVTTNVLGDVVSNLVCDAADVVTLMPVGADPHDFQISAQEAAQLREADVIIVNGANFEEGLISAIESAESDGIPVYEAISTVQTIEYGEGGGHDHGDEHSDEHDDDHGDEEHSDHDDEHSDEEHSDHDDEHSDEEHSDHDDEHSDEEHSDKEHDDHDDHGHDDHEGHDHSGDDPHFFTDVGQMMVA